MRADLIPELFPSFSSSATTSTSKAQRPGADFSTSSSTSTCTSAKEEDITRTPAPAPAKTYISIACWEEDCTASRLLSYQFFRRSTFSESPSSLSLWLITEDGLDWVKLGMTKHLYRNRGFLHGQQEVQGSTVEGNKDSTFNRDNKYLYHAGHPHPHEDAQPVKTNQCSNFI
ncbi:unnamed protein product [Amoebophrya sp. A25]|nr:unnamed protein product [Amoebophrya sp. A25]|eukprot:GSA25T00023939001.1